MKLAKTLQLIERQIITGQMQQTVYQHRPVARREQKSVAAEPLRIFRVVPEEFCPQDIRGRSHAERQPRMPGFRLLHRVERKRADRIDTKLVEVGFLEFHNVNIYTVSSRMKEWLVNFIPLQIDGVSRKDI